MPSPSVDRTVFRDLSWWHWTLTVPLLGAQLAGRSWGAPAAIALCIAVGVLFWVRIRRIQPYPVQVRIAYLGLLLTGLLPGMQWVHGVQFVGTAARALVGYCLLIRLLKLLPFNRHEPLTARFVWQILMRDPCVGGLLAWGVPDHAAECCSPTRDTAFSAAGCRTN